MPRDNHCRLSVVVPCYNEQQVLPEFHRRLTALIDAASLVDLELIYVDDGSRDDTLGQLRAIQSEEPRVRVVALSRNFGQPVAVTAGMAESTGDAVAVIDADLQDPPEVLMEMLARWRDGVDVAYGVRLSRMGETWFKRVTSRCYGGVLSAMSEVDMPVNVGDFRLMDRRAADVFLAMPERDRFLRGMFAWTGFRQEAVPFDRPARLAGETNYTLGKMVTMAMSGLLSFSLLPLRLAAFVGLTVATLALLGICVGVILRLVGAGGMDGWSLLLVAALFVGGVQLIFIGVLGEYLGRVYSEVRRRPLYVVKERLGFPNNHQESRRIQQADS